MSTALVTQNGSMSAVEPFINQDKRMLLANTLLRGATDNELELFVSLCNAKRLDPFTRQIYGIKTGNGGLQMFASIDGLRVIAQRSGQYAGQMGPFWCGKDGQWTDVWLASEPPAAAKVGVLRKGWPEPMWGVATMASYGKQSPTWKQMPDMMLAKCAESIALRKAFPDDISGLYVREEFGEVEAPEALPYTPQATVTPLRPAPVVAEVVDASTGEIAPTKETADQKKLALGNAIKELRTELKWDADRVRVEAERQNLSLNSVAGLTKMVGILEEYVDLARAEDGIDQDEEDYEALEAEAAAQGTLLEAEIAPVDRWLD